MIVGIVLLSLGDLLLTVTYLRSTGLVEANPIAGYLIRATGSATALAVYKILTVGVCIALLYRLRRLVEGEVAAWCAMVILGVVALHWYQYARYFEDYSDVTVAQHEARGNHWLTLD